MPGINFKQLREQITMSDVLSVINWKAVRRTGSSERGPCPVHGSSSETSTVFSVDRQGARFQCFKCGTKGNQLDLYAAVTKLRIYEAAKMLCERAGVQVPIVSMTRWKNSYSRQRRIKKVGGSPQSQNGEENHTFYSFADEFQREPWEERAAIMEFDGRLPKEEAERLAFVEIQKLTK